jgi:hypothetical protein
MNRNTTRFAFATKCGFLAASGFAGSEARAGKKPSRESKSIIAKPAKPLATSQRNSRRVRPHGVTFRTNRCDGTCMRSLVIVSRGR